jgi:hypothetical protein
VTASIAIAGDWSAFQWRVRISVRAFSFSTPIRAACNKKKLSNFVKFFGRIDASGGRPQPGKLDGKVF